MTNTKIKGFALGFSQIKSNKTGKIYYKFGFYTDDGPCSFMTGQDKGREILQAPCFNKLAETHQPQPCELSVGLELTERGNFINLVAVK